MRPVPVSNGKPSSNKIKFTQVPDDTGLDLTTNYDYENNTTSMTDYGKKSLQVLAN